MKDNLCGKKYFPQSCKDEMRESAVDGQINVLRLCQRRFFQNRQYFAVDSSKEYLPTQVAFHVAKSMLRGKWYSPYGHPRRAPKAGSGALAVCRRERVLPRNGELGGHYRAKRGATDMLLPSRMATNEPDYPLSDRLLELSLIALFFQVADHAAFPPSLVQIDIATGGIRRHVRIPRKA